MGEISRLRAWTLAARPKTLLAAIAPVAVGTGMAEAREGLAPLPALAALLGAVLIQIGANLANDYYDFVKGGDTEDRVGPLRVTQAGLVEPGKVRRGMWMTFAAAMVVGAYLTWVAGWPVVVIGILSILAGIGYTGGPYPLAYFGLGDLFVFVFFGLVAVGGTFYVQTLYFAPDLLLAGAAVGALNTAILVVNNLRDLETDRAVGKRTLAVYIGHGATRLEYAVLLGSAFTAPILGVAVFDWTPWSALALLAGLPAVLPLQRVVSAESDPATLNPALGQTALVTGIFGLLMALGFALG